MSVIPLTLAISLCLVLTFLVFFLREHARSRMSSPERDSMLPFGDEKQATAGATVISFKGREPGQHPKHRKDHHHHHEHGPSGECKSGKAEHERCHDCPSRGKQC